jgi:hypothetical protein
MRAVPFGFVGTASCRRTNGHRSVSTLSFAFGSPRRPSSLRLQAAAGGSQGAGLSILAGIVPGGAPTSDDASLLHQVVHIRRGHQGQPGRFTSVAGKGSTKALNPSSRWEELDPVDAVDPAEAGEPYDLLCFAYKGCVGEEGAGFLLTTARSNGGELISHHG